MLSKLKKYCFFAIGIWLQLLGVFLCLDAVIPKERPTSAGAPLLEFLLGLLLIISGLLLVRTSRLKKPPTD
jgi:hypothetical protein